MLINTRHNGVPTDPLSFSMQRSSKRNIPKFEVTKPFSLIPTGVPVNSKQCQKKKEKFPTFHFFGNSFYCVMWPEGTTSLSGRRSWNVRTVLYDVLSNVRNMYEQLRNGCSLSRKWLGHPERILMMLRGPLPVGPPDYRVGLGW